MIRLLPAVLLCAACAQASDDNQPAPAGYATQLTAPSPDYAAMEFSIAGLEPGEIEREATAKPPADALEIGQIWYDRIERAGFLGGAGFAGKGPDGAVVMMDLLVTADEFDAWTAKNGWTFPQHIDLRFQNRLLAPAVSDAAKAGIRLWPASQRRTGMQNMAALGGRVVLRDGCFFYQGWGNEGAFDTLAWFLMETGLDVDEEGYLVLIDRNTGHLAARVGEQMGWAGPNAVVITDEQKAALFAACGEHEIESVGNPESREKTYVQYPHLRPVSSPPAPPGAPPSLPPAPPAQPNPPPPPPPPPAG